MALDVLQATAKSLGFFDQVDGLEECKVGFSQATPSSCEPVDTAHRVSVNQDRGLRGRKLYDLVDGIELGVVVGCTLEGPAMKLVSDEASPSCGAGVSFGRAVCVGYDCLHRRHYTTTQGGCTVEYVLVVSPDTDMITEDPFVHLDIWERDNWIHDRSAGPRGGLGSGTVDPMDVAEAVVRLLKMVDVDVHSVDGFAIGSYDADPEWLFVTSHARKISEFLSK
jgi:hypothetical protein